LFSGRRGLSGFDRFSEIGQAKGAASPRKRSCALVLKFI
jgi:hypothetical protein